MIFRTDSRGEDDVKRDGVMMRCTAVHIGIAVGGEEFLEDGV